VDWTKVECGKQSSGEKLRENSGGMADFIQMATMGVWWFLIERPLMNSFGADPLGYLQSVLPWLS
jgi:hypothetical protein